ncbi:MAG: tRNA (N6-isopentenyl adenosine(37)-C2)-methylthiotransferase MiaB [Chlorobiaceae bacterium]|nr:tRNA (N6-isopentenyl adenosine(37)-C2)-methylthiotransferase MiaB [Chlorobiaceae bacterium]
MLLRQNRGREVFLLKRDPAKFHIYTFGCQMNQADSDIMTTLLRNEGYLPASSEDDAGIILLNTCAVRENAVERIEHRLQHLKGLKRKDPGLLVGLSGCVPQYRREKLFDDFPVIDFLAGPDAYRSLPSLIAEAASGCRRVSSLEFDISETYVGVAPSRNDSLSAFVPVMRGCNNMCAFCVVPFTRGRERSHPFGSIINEVREISERGIREITLLGQNVNSYRDPETGMDFPQLLDAVSREVPELRIRFTTSHPKDMSRSLAETIASRTNICNHIHLPVQSGSTRMLGRMNRGHTIEEYRAKIDMIRAMIPGISFSTDIIAGFCGESEDDHRKTLELMRDIRFDSAFMFYYSVRPGTLAASTMQDDVSEEVKKRRLQEIIDIQSALSADLHHEAVGTVVEVLAETESRRSSGQLMGRTETNRVVVFDRGSSSPGDLLMVKITGSTSATLTGESLPNY